MPVLTQNTRFESTSHNTPDTPFCMYSPSAHTWPVKPADRQYWPFAKCPKLSAVCSNNLWMSVCGRAVCKLTVLSSQGRKIRTKQHNALRLPRRWISSSRCNPLWPVQFGIETPKFRRHLQFSPSRNPEERSSAFPLTLYLFALLIMSVQQPSSRPQQINIHNHVYNIRVSRLL